MHAPPWPDHPARLRDDRERVKYWHIEATREDHSAIVGTFFNEEDAHEVATDWAKKGYTVRVVTWDELLIPAMLPEE